jgi:hypothetical protein
MSIFCFNLHQPVDNLNQLKALIELASNQIPDTLFACMDYKGQHLALRICSDNDILSLNQICRNSPVSLLYSVKTTESCNDYQSHLNCQAKSSIESDFSIISASGPQDGDSVIAGQMFEKCWKIQVIGNKSEITFRCVAGDYVGVYGEVKWVDDGFELVARVFAAVKGWSSSVWRAFSYGLPFGPALWIEVDVE